MKNLLYTIIFMSGAVALAQNPVDHMETTQVKSETVKKDGEMIETKVKIITKKEQEVKTDPRQANQLNGDQIITPTKVTKEVMIDNDSDSSYETKLEITYYTYNNRKYGFKTNKNGFVMTTMEGEKEVILGTAIKSSNNQFYIMNTSSYSGVGYFDENKNFVVEYYDKNSNTLATESFEEMKL